MLKRKPKRNNPHKRMPALRALTNKMKVGKLKINIMKEVKLKTRASARIARVVKMTSIH